MPTPAAAARSRTSTSEAPARAGCVASTEAAHTGSPRVERRRANRRVHPKRWQQGTPRPAAGDRLRLRARRPVCLQKKGHRLVAFLISQTRDPEFLPADPVRALDLKDVGGPIAEKRRTVAVEVEVTELVKAVPLLGPHEIQCRPRSILPPEDAGAPQRAQVEIGVIKGEGAGSARSIGVDCVASYRASLGIGVGRDGAAVIPAEEIHSARFHLGELLEA